MPFRAVRFALAFSATATLLACGSRSNSGKADTSEHGAEASEIFADTFRASWTGYQDQDGRRYTGAYDDDQLAKLTKLRELQTRESRALAESIRSFQLSFTAAVGPARGDSARAVLRLQTSSGGARELRFEGPVDRTARTAQFLRAASGAETLSIVCANDLCTTARFFLKQPLGANRGEARAAFVHRDRIAFVHALRRAGAGWPQARALPELESAVRTTPRRRLVTLEVGYGISLYSLEIPDGGLCPAGRLVETFQGDEPVPGLACEGKAAPASVKAILMGNSTAGTLFFRFEEGDARFYAMIDGTRAAASGADVPLPQDFFAPDAQAEAAELPPVEPIGPAEGDATGKPPALDSEAIAPPASGEAPVPREERNAAPGDGGSAEPEATGPRQTAPGQRRQLPLPEHRTAPGAPAEADRALNPDPRPSAGGPAVVARPERPSPEPERARPKNESAPRPHPAEPAPQPRPPEAARPAKRTPPAETRPPAQPVPVSPGSTRLRQEPPLPAPPPAVPPERPLPVPPPAMPPERPLPVPPPAMPPERPLPVPPPAMPDEPLPLPPPAMPDEPLPLPPPEIPDERLPLPPAPMPPAPEQPRAGRPAPAQGDQRARRERPAAPAPAREFVAAAGEGFIVVNPSHPATAFIERSRNQAAFAAAIADWQTPWSRGGRAGSPFRDSARFSRGEMEKYFHHGRAVGPAMANLLTSVGLWAETVYLTLIESGFMKSAALDPRALNPSGAGGPMQILPVTAREVGLRILPHVGGKLHPCDERADWRKAIIAGGRYFGTILRNVRNDPFLAAVGYTKGPYSSIASRKLYAIAEAGLSYWSVYRLHMTPTGDEGESSRDGRVALALAADAHSYAMHFGAAALIGRSPRSFNFQMPEGGDMPADPPAECGTR